VEVAASLLTAAAARGDRVGLAAGSVRLAPQGAGISLEAALDVLAAVQLAQQGIAPRPPADPLSCVLVTARGSGGDWGDVLHVDEREKA
jgi:uncharacterized protein (DUF58 family)